MLKRFDSVTKTLNQGPSEIYSLLGMVMGFVISLAFASTTAALYMFFLTAWWSYFLGIIAAAFVGWLFCRDRKKPETAGSLMGYCMGCGIFFGTGFSAIIIAGETILSFFFQI